MRDKESLKLGVWLRADSPKSRVQTRVGQGGVASKKDRSKAVGAVRAVECGGCEDCWREGGRGLNFEKLFIIHVSDQSMVNAATDVSGVAALIGNNGENVGQSVPLNDPSNMPVKSKLNWGGKRWSRVLRSEIYGESICKASVILEKWGLPLAYDDVMVVRKKNKFLLEDDGTMLLDATTGEDELVDCELVVQ
ncbi:hypothetical protein Q3G72_001279 [Acer saccharum]|nr:hypothetical protein Q3G72_001279 [Acer saccharum]